MPAVYLSLLLLLLSGFSTAQAETPTRDILANVQKQYARSGSLAGFIKSLKSELSDENFAFLSKQISDPNAGRAFPKMVLQTGDSLRVEYHGISVVLKVTSLAERTFEVNNRPLDFMNDNASAVWEKIGAALPKIRSSARNWNELFLPSANAAEDSEKDIQVFQDLLAGSVFLAIGSKNPCKSVPDLLKQCEEIGKAFGSSDAASAEVREKACPDVGSRLFGLIQQNKEMEKDKRCKSQSEALKNWRLCLNEIEAKRKKLGCLGDGPTYDGPAGIQK